MVSWAKVVVHRPFKHRDQDQSKQAWRNPSVRWHHRDPVFTQWSTRSILRIWKFVLCFKTVCFLTAIRLLEAKPARQLLPVRRGLRGDDLAWGRTVERRALQLPPDFHLQKGNRYARNIFRILYKCNYTGGFYGRKVKSCGLLNRKLSHGFCGFFQSHAGSPLWSKMLACLEAWSLVTRSTPCSAITVNQASSRGTPPPYAAGPMASGTSRESPAQAVSALIRENPCLKVTQLTGMFSPLTTLFFVPLQLRPTTSHLRCGAATTTTIINTAGTVTTTSITPRTIESASGTKSSSRVTTTFRAFWSLSII